MIPYSGKFNEYAQLYSELGNVTIMDLIKSFNDKKDLEDRLKFDVEDLKREVLAISKLMGYIDRYALQKAANETNLVLSDNKILLKIDRSGNIWLNGILENNPTRIGKEIVKIAQSYRENLPIEKMTEYLNVREHPLDQDVVEDAPF